MQDIYDQQYFEVYSSVQGNEVLWDLGGISSLGFRGLGLMIQGFGVPGLG